MGAGASQRLIRVLGPFEVEAGNRVLDLGGPRPRTVLALLVAGAGRVVSLPALMDGVWGKHTPPDADRTVRSYVSRLRKALRPAAAELRTPELIVTVAPGYALRVDPDAVDAARFERLAADGRRALADGRPAVAAERLAAALALWRGEAYGEFGDTPDLRTEAARLDRVRLSAVADRIEADLAAGTGGSLIAELEESVRRHPGHERLWGQLMTALYRAGRQADALGAFQRARAVLIEEFGLEPSPELAAIHQQVLSQDPRLLPAPAPARSRPPAPRRLVRRNSRRPSAPSAARPPSSPDSTPSFPIPPGQDRTRRPPW
jgi:DNA-binding SARP family transcriptional activator